MTKSTQTVLLAQVFMTFMMAASMSGIMGLINVGFSAEWLRSWPKQFAVAWPIAFVLTLGVGRVAFGLANKITGGAD